MNKGFKALVSEANQQIVTHSVEDAMTIFNQEQALFVDIRDRPELDRDGQIPGAVHVSRGMLEFVVDPESPYHNPVFSESKPVLLYCASGGRSALAAKTLQEMGMANVSHMAGGLKGWKEAGGQTTAVS